MYSQATGEDTHGQPMYDNSDHSLKLWKYKGDSAEYAFFPMITIFPPAIQCLNHWMYFTYTGCMCKYAFPSYSSTFLPISFISNINSPSSCLNWMYVYMLCALIVKYYFCYQRYKKIQHNIKNIKKQWKEKSLNSCQITYFCELIFIHLKGRKYYIWWLFYSQASEREF